LTASPGPYIRFRDSTASPSTARPSTLTLTVGSVVGSAPITSTDHRLKTHCHGTHPGGGQATTVPGSTGASSPMTQSALEPGVDPEPNVCAPGFSNHRLCPRVGADSSSTYPTIADA